MLELGPTECHVLKTKTEVKTEIHYDRCTKTEVKTEIHLRLRVIRALAHAIKDQMRVVQQMLFRSHLALNLEHIDRCTI